MRDAGLWTGKKLYIVSMNEGVFPANHRLGGYVQERDLLHAPIRYGVPTQAHASNKQEAYFQQLFYLAESITFSYVKGLDPNHPLMPSPYLESLHLYEEEEWSWERRLNAPYAMNEQEQQLQLAYHLGKGEQLEALPNHIAKLKQNLDRLRTGEERLDAVFQEQLKSNVVSITALESYARCPFRYAMERVLKVPEPKEKQERVSPLIIGDMVHQLIESCYRELEVIGKPYSSLSMKAKERIPDLLFQRFEELWEEIEKKRIRAAKNRRSLA